MTELKTNPCTIPPLELKTTHVLCTKFSKLDEVTPFVAPCAHRDRDYNIGSNFWKFYLIRTGFTLGEPVSLVKVFRLFRLEWILLVFRVWTE